MVRMYRSNEDILSQQAHHETRDNQIYILFCNKSCWTYFRDGVGNWSPGEGGESHKQALRYENLGAREALTRTVPSLRRGPYECVVMEERQKQTENGADSIYSSLFHGLGWKQELGSDNNIRIYIHCLSLQRNELFFVSPRPPDLG